MEATARYLESKRSKLQSQSAKVAVVLYYEGFEQVDEFHLLVILNEICAVSFLLPRKIIIVRQAEKSCAVFLIPNFFTIKLFQTL